MKADPQSSADVPSAGSGGVPPPVPTAASATTVLTASFARRFPAGPTIRVNALQTSCGSGITVLFGASGSGKTTVLRCLAGLERPDEGSLCFGSETWFDSAANTFLLPQQRRVGFVPQNYALFPHLSVERNIAYSLNKLPASERQERVGETISWLGLEGLERRLPHELSGGQQQRVALGRAVIHQPRLLLLDEPLSALDAPTRLRLRTELRQLLRQRKIPTILVTHDRFEAMALGDELIIMDDGNIVQQGPVREVFSRPANLAVAGILSVETIQPGRIIQIADGLVTVSVGDKTLIGLNENLPANTRQVYVCIRAENVILTSDQSGQSSPRNRFPATVRALTPEGPMVRIDLDCGFPLIAMLTKQSCEEMDLKENSQALALVKTPHVHLIVHSI